MNPFQRRDDIANDVIHFTKGDSPAEAFAVIAHIVAERRLLGGTGYIKGNYTCVCFTEAPLAHLMDVFARTASAIASLGRESISTCLPATSNTMRA